jgi:hypothetical protein
MPRIVDYEHVLARLTSRGMKSLYHNSGSFGFVSTDLYCGWLGPPDGTLKESVRPVSRSVPEPHSKNLAKLLWRAWSTLLPGPIWIMPGSHWSYEFDHSSHTWMADALRAIEVDPTILQPRNNAPAIEFDLRESDRAMTFVEQLLDHLFSSDFTAAFPDHPAICTIHHHRQLWWRTNDASLRDRLLALPEAER